MEAKTIELKNVGSILIERSRRAKHLSLSVKPFKGARVAVPIGVSFASAEIFARSKIAWLKKHLDKMVLMEQAARALSKNKPIIQATARKHLIDRLNFLSQKYGFNYNRVFIRNQKTRWGSCSAKNNINLNINLVRLPEELIDYIILHELVHTRVKNHSRRFWDQMDKLLGDAKKLDRKLSEYSFLLI
ncbi:MAG: M48 family metallopeptidase [Desulfobacterales bacterium]